MTIAQSMSLERLEFKARKDITVFYCLFVFRGLTTRFRLASHFMCMYLEARAQSQESSSGSLGKPGWITSSGIVLDPSSQHWDCGCAQSHLALHVGAEHQTQIFVLLANT